MATRCDSCGKDMHDPETNVVLSGIFINFVSSREDINQKFLDAQRGPYRNDCYQFCYECVLRTMGAVPGPFVVPGEKHDQPSRTV